MSFLFIKYFNLLFYYTTKHLDQINVDCSNLIINLTFELWILCSYNNYLKLTAKLPYWGFSSLWTCEKYKKQRLVQWSASVIYSKAFFLPFLYYRGTMFEKHNRNHVFDYFALNKTKISSWGVHSFYIIQTFWHIETNYSQHWWVKGKMNGQQRTQSNNFELGARLHLFTH